MADQYFHDYENEPIGGDNPYYRCVHCHRTDPQINGQLEGHSPDCLYRLAKERGVDYPIQCSTCDGSGEIDSGGSHPWGESIFLGCPECEARDKVLYSRP